MRAPLAARRALGVAAVAAVAFVATVGPAAAAPRVPYTDPSAAGYLGICNRQGQQITSGSITSVPFAWEVVSSAAAPSAVSGSGRTATLYAYQPIEGEGAGDWSGEQITGTSQYSDPAHPMAVSTTRDFALSQFLAVFPPKWDGFIELRLFLDAPGTQPEVLSYPALSLQISGDTWQAVGGGSVDCTGGRAQSDEAILPTTTTAKGGSGSQSSSPSSTGAKSDSGGSSSPRSSVPGKTGQATDSSGGRGSGVRASALAASKSSNAAPLVVLIVVVVLLLAIAGWIVIRSRRRRVSPS
jgi:hypothetical protein